MIAYTIGSTTWTRYVTELGIHEERPSTAKTVRDALVAVPSLDDAIEVAFADRFRAVAANMMVFDYLTQARILRHETSVRKAMELCMLGDPEWRQIILASDSLAREAHLLLPKCSREPLGATYERWRLEGIKMPRASETEGF